MRKVFAAIFSRTETSLAAVIVIVAIVFSFSSPYFLTLSNASDLIEAYSVTTILAAGVFGLTSSPILVVLVLSGAAGFYHILDRPLRWRGKAASIRVADTGGMP